MFKNTLRLSIVNLRRASFLALAAIVISLCPLHARAQGGTFLSEIVSPVLDAKNQPVAAVAPDGRSYPVFRPAADSALVRAVRNELDHSFAQQALKLNRYARNLLLAESGTDSEALKAPMYLLLSGEEGGYARQGFWLEDARGRRWLGASYVDMVVDEGDIASGNFEEIFCHELAHNTLRALAGDFSTGPSHKMHQSMTVTDYPTAFDEGYAEHFQPVVRDASRNPVFRALAQGITATDLDMMWLSRIDTELRSSGVKRNLFVHGKALPAAALDPSHDPYALFIDGETSADFLTDKLKNGQQMMASEGVISTLFYRMVNDDKLRNHYRQPGFYAAFLGPSATSGDPQQAVSPYENVNLKLFAAMHKMNRDPSRAPMIEMIRAYVALFPDEAEAICGVFLDTTRGATVSEPLVEAFEQAASAGGRGNIEAFRAEARAAFMLLKDTKTQVAAGKLALDANLGPELWLVEPDFKIGAAVWDTDRTVSLTLNLNAASEAEFMTLPGIDLSAARRLVAARRARGFFASLDDLNRANLTPDTLNAIRKMFDQMKLEKAYRKP